MTVTHAEFDHWNWWVRSRAWISILTIVPFGLAAFLLEPPWIPEDTPWDWLVDVVAWLIFLGGATFRWWATLYIGGRKHNVVISDGPYAMCRNPLYVGTLLITASIPVFLHSLVFGVGLVLSSLIYLGITVPYEERMLRESFGSSYAQYCEQVPRFFPNWRRWHSPSVINVSLSGLLAEYKRMLRWVWVPLLAEAAAHWHAVLWSQGGPRLW